jgi:hypothetical protein
MPHVPTSGGQILSSCAVFADGTLLYGPVQTADVYIAGKSAKNFPVQIYGQTPPVSGCGVGGVQLPRDANGLLGVRFRTQGNDIYYTCNPDGSSCQPDVSPSLTTPNLVSKFQNDNNGITIALSAIPTSGASEPVLGLLIFGVGTQADNTPPQGTVPLLADPSTGLINLQIDGNNAPQALIDSGTSILQVNGPSLQTMCSDGFFYCPPPNTISLTLSSTGANTPAYTVNYTIGNADNLIQNGPNDVAFNDLAAAPGGGDSILGLSFFFGKTISFVFDKQQSPLGTGPINAIWAPITQVVGP